jgi:hypothetical protein
LQPILHARIIATGEVLCVAHTLRIARYALLGTLIALVVAAAGTLVSIGLDATSKPTWFAGGIEHFRCGVSQWEWVPLPYCELKAAARPDKIGPAMMLVTGVIGVVLTICLLVQFERRQAEPMTTRLTSNQEESAKLPAPDPVKSIPHLPTGETVGQPKLRLRLAERLERAARES